MTNTAYQTVAVALLAAAGFVRTASAQNTVNCSVDQQGVITVAQVYTGLQLLGAGHTLDEMSKGGDSTQFQYWFGSTDSAIVDRVSTTLKDVYYGLDDITYNCDCALTDTNAFVNAGDPNFQIFMCPPYFDQFAAGDMQMSTIVHEISHFVGTRDCTKPESAGACCYEVNWLAGCFSVDSVPSSPAAAHNLALSDPDTASNNAYNIGWFVTDGN